MRRFSQRHSLSTLSELNVTPLLDLAFVLLIIFMITTPLMEKSVDVVLPTDVAAKNAVNPALVQNISISRNETIKLNGQPVSLDQLESALAAMKQNQPDTAVSIRSHKELQVQKLVDVMAAVQRARITKVGVDVTNPGNE
jgi:biopolymer transport protein ExbD